MQPRPPLHSPSLSSIENALLLALNSLVNAGRLPQQRLAVGEKSHSRWPRRLGLGLEIKMAASEEEAVVASLQAMAGGGTLLKAGRSVRREGA